MNEKFYYGSTAYWFFMIMEVIIVLIINVVRGEFYWQTGFGIVALFIMGMLTMRQLKRKNKLTQRDYSGVQIVLYLVFSLTLSHIIDNEYVLFILLLVQSVLTFIFQDKGLCIFQTVLSVLALVLMKITGFPIVTGTPAMLEFNFEIGALLVVSWVMVNLIKYNEFQIRKNCEQERSLDDLLKVVEVKCDEARQAATSKSLFLSNMSHEIRTPINAVLGMNEMILRESRDPEILGYAENIKSAGNLLLSLINDILDFSKIESGKMEIVPVKYQLSSVLNDLVNMIAPRAKEKNLQLKVEAEPSIPNELYGDEVRIRQVVTNILTNAVKYTDQGQVTLKVDYQLADEKKLYLLVSVKDTGRGIKKEDMDKLFQSFKRLDQQKNRHIEGTGLGLSITASFVEMMGGTIQVESEYGVGSVFSVSIPQTIMSMQKMGNYEERFENGIRENETYQESFHAPQAKILIVDDNAMNLKVVTSLLKRTQIQIDTASGGMECLKMLREKKYDLLLLDHMMPIMDGIETLRQIKQEEIGAGMPVIALTANAISGSREMYIEQGFQDYLSKPIVGKSLEKLLVKWLPKELLQEVKETKEIPKETQTEDQQPESTLIDRETAMLYCADSEEIYHEMLKAYLEQKEKYRRDVETYYGNEDWDNYRITVHSIKSTSLTVGAVKLSEEAKELEMAAKENRIQTIRDNNEAFLQHYQEVMTQIEQMMATTI